MSKNKNPFGFCDYFSISTLSSDWFGSGEKYICIIFFIRFLKKFIKKIKTKNKRNWFMFKTLDNLCAQFWADKITASAPNSPKNAPGIVYSALQYSEART